MKKYNQRAAVFGVAGALALGTVVSAGVMAPADAVTSSYSCALATGTENLPVVGTLAIPASVESGRNLSGWAADMGVTIPPATVAKLAGAIQGLQTLGGSATGLAFSVAGAKALPLNDLAIPQTSPSADGLALLGSTTTKSYKAPLPGDYVVSMPKDFSFLAIGGFPGGVTSPLSSVPCHTDTPASLGTIHVVKAASATTAKLVNAPATTRKHAKIATTVRAAGGNATGTVVAMEGTKQLAKGSLTSGKKTLVLPLLKKGAHTIKVLYKGSAGTKTSSKSLHVTVKRG